MGHKKRIGAVLLCVIFALVVLVSSAFLIHEAGHECTGEDCPVCHIIAASGQLLRLMGVVFFALVSLLGLPDAGHAWHQSAGISASSPATLVNWKIQLNN